jgi:hypothetical protein
MSNFSTTSCHGEQVDGVEAVANAAGWRGRVRQPAEQPPLGSGLPRPRELRKRSARLKSRQSNHRRQLPPRRRKPDEPRTSVPMPRRVRPSRPLKRAGPRQRGPRDHGAQRRQKHQDRHAPGARKSSEAVYLLLLTNGRPALTARSPSGAQPRRWWWTGPTHAGRPRRTASDLGLKAGRRSLRRRSRW